VSHVFPLQEPEVGKDFAVRPHHLGVDSRSRAAQILLAQFRDDSMRCPQKDLFADGLHELAQPSLPVFADHPPETGVGGHFHGIREREVPGPITRAGEGESRVWHHFHAAVD
jgi:hypothetical protein